MHMSASVNAAGRLAPGAGTARRRAMRILFEFGYITFPLMAFTVFAFLVIVMLFVRERRDS